MHKYRKIKNIKYINEIACFMSALSAFLSIFLLLQTSGWVDFNKKRKLSNFNNYNLFNQGLFFFITNKFHSAYIKAMEQIFSIFQEIDLVIKQLKLNGKIQNTEEDEEEIKEEL